ncbi:MAG TPA: hypothetical protein VIP53_09180, partial [Nitrososphaera sp.]
DKYAVNRRYYGMLREKPAGIDFLGIIMVINGMFAIFSGIDSLVFASFLSSALSVNPPVTVAEVAQLAAIWGSIILALGIASLFVAYGLFKGRGWGWTGAVGLSIIGIIDSIMNIIAGYWPSIFTLILSGIILYYLYRPHVMAYFGKTATAPPSDAAAA